MPFQALILEQFYAQHTYYLAGNTKYQNYFHTLGSPSA